MYFFVLQWTQDESVCCVRNPNGEIVFYANSDFAAGPLPTRLSLKGLDSHFLSPKADNSTGGGRLAVYVPGQKGKDLLTGTKYSLSNFK